MILDFDRHVSYRSFPEAGAAAPLIKRLGHFNSPIDEISTARRKRGQQKQLKSNALQIGIAYVEGSSKPLPNASHLRQQ
jgi:hypothetical protein